MWPNFIIRNDRIMWFSYNRVRRFCAFTIGAVFFVSGLLKLMDPVGAGLVISEYYGFFGTDFLQATSLPAGFVLALSETVLGAALMTGLWRRIVAVVTIVFLAAFTLLTAVLVIFNPEMDCGCFGEAVHLTHFQSLVKNIVLCVLAAVAFTPLNRLGRPKRRKYVAFGIVASAVAAFGIYSLLYIPLVDFTDYRPASRLAASDSGSSEMYDATFIYEKDGRQESFTLDNLPDSTWTFVRTETVRTDPAEGTRPVLSFTDAGGEYRDYLAASGDVMILSVYDPAKVSEKKWMKTASLLPAAIDAGYHPIILVPGDYGTLSDSLEGRIPEETADAILQSAYFADYKTIITLNRSNCGATCFHDGYLIRKWSFRNLPSAEELARIAAENVDETVVETTTAGQVGFQAFVLAAFAVIFFI